MGGALLQFILSAAVIVIAGVVLTRSADVIAETTRLGRLFVGGVFLAAATSLPELFVDLSAISKDMPNLAVGDLLGSSLFNLLILGIVDLLHRSGKTLFSRTAAIHALSASMSITVTVLAGMAIFLGTQGAKIEVGRIGLGSLSILIAYGLGMRMVYREQKLKRESEIAETDMFRKKRLKRAAAIYLLSAGIILFVAPFIAESAGEIATLSGLGKSFVGTTLVAFCTSLPEFVSTVVAVRMGAFDLALGNIFGSNAFNMILLVPLDFFYEGALLASVSSVHILTCFSTILITAIAVMGQLYQVENRRRFLEPDATLVIALVFANLYLLYLFKEGF